MMKKMGISQQEIDATEVIIKTPEKEIVITNPQVSKVNMMGQQTFQVVGEIFSTFPEIEWLTTLYPLRWDEAGRAVHCSYSDGCDRRAFFRGEKLPGAGWYHRGWIQQESTFWRRSLWEHAGEYVDTSLQFAADFELWARFYQFAELYAIATPLGGFRKHKDQKTAHHVDDYVREAEEVLLRYGGCPYGKLESAIRSRLLQCLPWRFKHIAKRLGILCTYKVCMHEGRGGRWKILTV